jgi:hypothetical protein
MALGDPNVPGFSELLSATIQRIEAPLIDQVLQSHPTLDALKSRHSAADGPSKIVPVRGSLVNRTAVSDDLGTFATGQDSDIISTAKYTFSNPIVTPTSVAFKALALNAGQNQVVDMVRAHIEAAKDDHALTLAQAMHGTGTAAGEWNSLPTIVDDTAVLGGIDPAVSTWWKSSKVTGAYATDSVSLKFRELLDSIADASMKTPDLIICGSNIFSSYEAELDDRIRYNALSEGDTRFRSLRFAGIEVRRDGIDCDPDTAYFLHTPSLFLHSLRGTFMAPQPEQVIQGTLTSVVPLATVLMVGTTARRDHGKLVMS